MGRDRHAEELLHVSSSLLHIALPSVSIMEAWSVFEDMRSGGNIFREGLKKPINDFGLRQDETSLHAKELLQHLEYARTESADLLNDVERRLRDILEKLAGKQTGFSAVELLPLTDSALAQSLLNGPTKDPTDNLILAIILDHARLLPEEQKVFLSGNAKDFGTPEVRELLAAADITYFTRTESFLGWFQAQNSHSPSPTG